MRFATVEDAARIIEIYKPYCLNTTISFEKEPPTLSEMQKRIENTIAFYPYLVEEEGGEIIAYAYASNHRTRDGYQWSSEASVYVDENHQRKGIGKVLYQTIFEILRKQGMVNVYAGIALPNPKSIEFHKSMGFKKVGTYKNVGFKFGSWVDVTWWHLELNKPSVSPEQPKSVHDLNLDLLTTVKQT